MTAKDHIIEAISEHTAMHGKLMEAIGTHYAEQCEPPAELLKSYQQSQELQKSLGIAFNNCIDFI